MRLRPDFVVVVLIFFLAKITAGYTIDCTKTRSHCLPSLEKRVHVRNGIVSLQIASSSPALSDAANFMQNAVARIGCSSAAAAATWGLIACCTVSPVVASSIVGVAAGVVLPTPLATAAFCGTFCGMSSRLVTPTAWSAAQLGAMAAMLLAALDASDTSLLKGYGGRLGVVAALAGTLSVAASQAHLLFQPSLAAAAAAPKALISNAWAALLGTMAMRLWARRLAALIVLGSTSWLVQPTRTPDDRPSRREWLIIRLSSPVTSASIIGLLAGLLLGSARSSACASVFTGAFVAMSAPDRLRSKELLGAATLAGFAQAGLASVSVGVGGKLGVAAAIGVHLICAIRAAATAVLILQARYTEQLRIKFCKA